MWMVRRDGRPGRGLLAGIAVGAALALAGCVENPPGSFAAAEFRADPSEVQHDLYFQPGSGSLAGGEAARLNRRLQSLLLRPDDDIVVNLGSTGSEVIDARREATVRATVAGSPARLRVVTRPGFTLASRERKDAALVQIQRFSQVRVVCPNQGRDYIDDNFARREITIGCTNAANVASMTVEARDLTAPGRLAGSEGIATVGAVERYRTDTIKEPSAVSVVGN